MTNPEPVHAINTMHWPNCPEEGGHVLTPKYFKRLEIGDLGIERYISDDDVVDNHSYRSTVGAFSAAIGSAWHLAAA